MSESDQLADEPIHHVLRRILDEADEPLSVDEIENRLYQRLQAGIRGLKHTGELDSTEETVSHNVKKYGVTDN